jgi:cytochrome c oxidase subunit 2
MQKLSMVLVLTLLVLGGCFHKKEVKTQIDNNKPVKVGSLGNEEAKTVKTEEKVQPTDMVEEVVLEARRFEFSPSTVTVTAGSTVKMTIKSVDVQHGFSLPDFNISETLEPNKTVEIEFVADKKGTFNFFCNTYCGAGHSSMNGRLIVE